MVEKIMNEPFAWLFPLSSVANDDPDGALYCFASIITPVRWLLLFSFHLQHIVGHGLLVAPYPIEHLRPLNQSAFVCAVKLSLPPGVYLPTGQKRERIRCVRLQCEYGVCLVCVCGCLECSWKRKEKEKKEEGPQKRDDATRFPSFSYASPRSR